MQDLVEIRSPKLEDIDKFIFRWDDPTMKVIADQKRRVVLPPPAKSGDVYECQETGDRIVLVRMKTPERHVPPIATKALNRKALRGVNLDEPALPSTTDQSVPQKFCYQRGN